MRGLRGRFKDGFSLLVYLVQIVWVVFTSILLPELRFSSRHKTPRPERVRATIDRLGGAWIKLGQMLALRYDLIPIEYSREFYKLFDKVTPFSYQEVSAIIQRELGGPPESVFRSFERIHMASASIGQVHRAVLHTGEKVAVKVQRPQIHYKMHRDIELMYGVVPLINYIGLFGATDTHSVVREFETWVNNELDFKVEAAQAQNIDDNAGTQTLEKNPHIYWNYTTSRVLTMELIEGIPLSDIIDAKRRGDIEYVRRVESLGYDLKEMAKHVNWNLLNQVHIEGYFHADLHPANMFVCPGNVIAYVDFGIVGNISEELRESGISYFWNLFQGRTGQASVELMRWVRPSYQTDVEAARHNFINIMEKWLFQIQNREIKFAEAPVLIEVEILKAIRRHKMILEDEMVVYMKTFSTAFAVIHDLDPEFDVYTEANKFFAQMVRQKVTEIADLRNIPRFIFEYGMEIRHVFQTIDRLEEAQNTIDTVAVLVRRRLQVLGVLILSVLLGILFTALLLFAPQILHVPARMQALMDLPFISSLRNIPRILYAGLIGISIVLFLISLLELRKVFTEERQVPVERRRRSPNRSNSGSLGLLKPPPNNKGGS